MKETVVRNVLNYLGYPSDAKADQIVMDQIEKVWSELETIAGFQYVYGQYDTPLDFMLQHPAYMEYLKGANGFLLCATTLGVQVDRRIKRIETNDMQYAVIFDAVASVFLEDRADAYEAELPFAERGYRFCPGYGGTPVLDCKTIATQLRAHRIGLTFLDSGLMVPMKSMVGIIRLGGDARKSCAGCVAAKECAYRRRGTTCWNN